jgi:hypothetical protein
MFEVIDQFPKVATMQKFMDQGADNGNKVLRNREDIDRIDSTTAT